MKDMRDHRASREEARAAIDPQRSFAIARANRDPGARLPDAAGAGFRVASAN